MNKNILLTLTVLVLFACGGGGDSVIATTDEGEETGGGAGQLVPTKILTELFTSTTCGPCTSQNNILDNYLNPSSSTYVQDIADKWIILRYHVWWPAAGDPYYAWNQSPVIWREGYYNVGYVPHAFTQGTADSGSGASTWRSDARQIDTVTASSLFDIDMDVSLDGYQLSGTVTVTSAANVENLGFNYYIVVSHDESQYSAPNGQTVFHQVFIDFLNSGTNDEGSVTYGEALNLKQGESLTTNINWSLDANWPNDSGVSWSPSDLNILAFVQYDGGGDNDKRIYQVEEIDFGS
tara:strand:- start:815 stop:1693 length:879 start_codon:yes stop_codon:yes gene_type:complete